MNRVDEIKLKRKLRKIASKSGVMLKRVRRGEGGIHLGEVEVDLEDIFGSKLDREFKVWKGDSSSDRLRYRE